MVKCKIMLYIDKYLYIFKEQIFTSKCEIIHFSQH